MSVFALTLNVSSIWLIEMALSGATTQDKRGPGSDGNEGVFCIRQNYNITGASTPNDLESYQGHSLGEVLSHCRDAISIFSSLSQLDSIKIEFNVKPAEIGARELKNYAAKFE